MVCTSQLRHDLLTIWAFDNLDHNPSNTTTKDSFHGTGINLFQFPTQVNKGSPQAAVNWATTSKSLKLPDTIVPAVALKKENVEIPNSSLSSSSGVTDGHLKEAILAENNCFRCTTLCISQVCAVEVARNTW